jgi:RNA polymerase-binding transcription factor DksA
LSPKKKLPNTAAKSTTGAAARTKSVGAKAKGPKKGPAGGTSATKTKPKSSAASAKSSSEKKALSKGGGSSSAKVIASKERPKVKTAKETAKAQLKTAQLKTAQLKTAKPKLKEVAASSKTALASKSPLKSKSTAKKVSTSEKPAGKTAGKISTLKSGAPPAEKRAGAAKPKTATKQSTKQTTKQSLEHKLAPTTTTAAVLKKSKPSPPQDYEKFRGLLHALRQRLMGDVNMMSQEALGGSDGAADNHAPIHPAEVGTHSFEQEFTLNLLSSDGDRLDRIEAALEKIADGSYGACDECGGRIPKARLEIIPDTPYCVKCASRLES